MDVVGLDGGAARGDDPRLGRAHAQPRRLLDHLVDLLERGEQLLVVVGALVVLSEQRGVLAVPASGLGRRSAALGGSLGGWRWL